MFRSERGVRFTRERIGTTDDDFIDLDWCSVQSARCAILLHGLEGTANRHYMLGMAGAFHRRGWNTVSMNLRGCSGEPNRKIRSYHHGVTDDLSTVVNHVVSKEYNRISIVGISLSGNVLLKYLGEGLYPVPKQLMGRHGIGPAAMEILPEYLRKRRG